MQARTSSVRLPGKVLADIHGRPMVLHVLERAARLGAPVVLATSSDPSDDALADVVGAAGWRVSRGSLGDVLDRFVRAAPADADTIVRVTADCPLFDPAVGRMVLDAVAGADYASNTIDRTFPDGLDCEAFARKALLAAGREAVLTSDREHVTPFIRGRPDRFRLRSVRGRVDLAQERWTVDNENDLLFVRAVYDHLATRGPVVEAGLDAVLEVLGAEPELRRLNTTGLAGAERSLALRPVTWEDRSLLLAWANDPDARRNSFQTSPIGWGEHVRWLTARLADKGCRMYMILVGGRPSGVVRFEERQDDRTEVSITLDRSQRGLGLAADVLRAARRRYVEEKGPAELVALIKPGNVASIRAFRRAGFAEAEERADRVELRMARAAPS